MTWFEQLTGCTEGSPDSVRRNLSVDSHRLHSNANGKSWAFGELEILSLAELRQRVRELQRNPMPLVVRELVADVQQLHQDEGNADAVFQVASQFNLLEMTSPVVTPERGVGIYEHDFTQGPACAIAAGAGTIFRNYFVVVNGEPGQSEDRQIDCLAPLGQRLGNSDQRLWSMVNGYALPSREGLTEVDRLLRTLDETARDPLRQLLQIGVQSQVQVTLGEASHTVTQVFCSAMPVAYTHHSQELWAAFATLVLEAAYEATVCAAIINAHRTGNHQLFLTLLGGGAFGNQLDWILAAIRRSLALYSDSGLEVSIVSYGRSHPRVQQFTTEFP